jgi:hypothetical protein
VTDTEGVQVTISAQIGDLLDKMKTASGAVKTSTEEMQGHFGSLGKVVENLKAPFLALTGVLAGGALFKGVLDETVNWNREVSKTAKTLGTTTQEASVLAVALEGLGLSTETYTNAAIILARQAAAGGKGFEKLGIEIRDADGKLRSSQDLMKESLEVIGSMTAGMDRNTAGAALFGRQWKEVEPLLRLNAAAMDEAKERAERLHLIVGPEGVAQTRAYQKAMREVHEVGKSIAVQIGSSLMPTMVQLGGWLSEGGTSAAEGFSYAIKGIIQALLFLKSLLDTLTTGWIAMFSAMTDGVRSAGAVIERLVHGDITGAIAAAKKGATEIRDDWKNAGAQIADSWSGFAKKSSELWGAAPKPAAAAPGGGESFEGKPDKDQSDAKKLEALKKELEGKKLLEENWFTWSHAREAQFWQEKLELSGNSAKVEQEIRLMMRAQEKDVALQSHEERVAGLKASLAEFHGDAAQRIAILKSIAAEQTRVYGEGSRQAIAASKDVTKQIQADAKAQMHAMAATAQHIGQTFGAAISGMIEGTMSFSKAMATMAKEVIAIILQIAIKSVTASAVKAGGEAASSQAGIPIIGPALAVGAMTAMVAVVMGLLGNLSSARDGFDIPSGVNPITQLHAREMVLPAEQADVIRGMAGNGGMFGSIMKAFVDSGQAGPAGGGGDGGEVHLHFHGPADGNSIRAFVQTQEFARAFREMQRRGRIG